MPAEFIFQNFNLESKFISQNFETIIWQVFLLYNQNNILLY